MKSKWLLLLFGMAVGGFAIGSFTKEPWTDWLLTCLVMGAVFWIAKDEQNMTRKK